MSLGGGDRVSVSFALLSFVPHTLSRPTLHASANWVIEAGTLNGFSSILATFLSPGGEEEAKWPGAGVRVFNTKITLNFQIELTTKYIIILWLHINENFTQLRKKTDKF